MGAGRGDGVLVGDCVLVGTVVGVLVGASVGVGVEVSIVIDGSCIGTLASVANVRVGVIVATETKIVVSVGGNSVGMTVMTGRSDGKQGFPVNCSHQLSPTPN